MGLHGSGRTDRPLSGGLDKPGGHGAGDSGGGKAQRLDDDRLLCV